MARPISTQAKLPRLRKGDSRVFDLREIARRAGKDLNPDLHYLIVDNDEAMPAELALAAHQANVSVAAFLARGYEIEEELTSALSSKLQKVLCVSREDWEENEREMRERKRSKEKVGDVTKNVENFEELKAGVAVRSNKGMTLQEAYDRAPTAAQVALREQLQREQLQANPTLDRKLEQAAQTD